ncbi:Uma2 family endonuclease [Corallococcus terminator]
MGVGRNKDKKPATYEDIEALPVGWVGEIVEGLLYASPRPAMGHLHVASRLGALIIPPFDWARGGPGGWWFLDEPELHFGANVVVPDIAGWRRERVPEPPEPETPWLSLAPDWVCEVLSPSTRSTDRVRKLPLYHRSDVRHAWLIDPLRCSLESYRSVSRGWERVGLHEGPVVIREEPFEAVPLDLGLLWLPRRAGKGHKGDAVILP